MVLAEMSTSKPSLLRLSRGATKAQALGRLDEATEEAHNFGGLDASLLSCTVDTELADKILCFCAALPRSVGSSLQLAHNDLSSGTDCEQRLFDRLAEREAREKEKAYHEKAKKDSANSKDFAVSAAQKRAAIEGIDKAVARLAEIDEELKELNFKKEQTPWYALFSQMEVRGQSGISCLDLSDCGLHATGLAMLTNVLLELEQRADDVSVSELVLDGNDVGDIGMSAIASLMRLTSSLKALRLRNTGLTERGVSQILAGLVSNKSLALLDLRSNGLATPAVSRAALEGVRRFNGAVEVLLD
mmetsp:Transcript_45532/g.114721  ORF Transcript_45532/g.114721 Transcript_45532/m.114721 type:complete len:302 (-) Transcript_45532:235-1140(-)